MKLNYSLSTWNFEAYTKPETLEEAVEQVAHSGYGIEVWPEFRGDVGLFTEAQRKRLVKILKDVRSTLHGYVYTMEEHRTQIDAARDTGSSLVVVHSDHLGLSGQSRDYGMARDVVAYASENGVRIALENGVRLESLDVLRSALEAVPDLGACLDIGHLFVAHDHPLKEYLRVLGSRIIHVHVQDVHMVPGTRRAKDDSHRPPGQCDIPLPDWQMLFSALEQIHFAGSAVMEIRPFDPTEIASQTTEFFASVSQS
jgi:sugar phosphate isomerase/epimerase